MYQVSQKKATKTGESFFKSLRIRLFPCGTIQPSGEELAKELLERHVYIQDGHLWHRDGYSDEMREKIRQFYEKCYKQ